MAEHWGAPVRLKDFNCSCCPPDYPWDENIVIKISTKTPSTFKLHIRIPSWARKFDLRVNGNSAEHILENGYAFVERQWNDGDQIYLYLPMPVETLEAHPAVRQASGKVALKRGPVVYCVEEVDNGDGIFNVTVLVDTEFLVEKQDVAGFELPVLKFQEKRRIVQPNEALYHPVNADNKALEAVTIPYFMWANRGENEMTVWIKRA